MEDEDEPPVTDPPVEDGELVAGVVDFDMLIKVDEPPVGEATAELKLDVG